MSDELLGKAQTTVQQYEIDKNYLIETYSIKDTKVVDFILEYIKCRNQVTAYRKVYGSKMATNVAAAAASRLLKKVKFSLIDILDLTGHGNTDIAEALNKLKKDNPDKYLTHIEKLRQLDIQRVEHGGSVGVYNIQFTSDKVEDEDA